MVIEGDFETDSNQQQLPTEYAWDKGEMALGEQHTMSKEKGPLKIDISETMEFIFDGKKKEDLKAIRHQRFVKKNWTLLCKLTTAEGVVKLFEKDADGERIISLSYYYSFTHSLFVVYIIIFINRQLGQEDLGGCGLHTIGQCCLENDWSHCSPPTAMRELCADGCIDCKDVAW